MAEETVSSRLIYEGKILNLRVDQVRLPDGRLSQREIVEHASCVAIVAVDKDGNLLLVRQFRQAAGKELLEIPAGSIEAGEEPVDAVCRELAEETGYRPQKVTRIGGFYSSPGFCTEYMHLYLASDLVAHKLTAEDSEGIEVVAVPPGEILKLIKSGVIEDIKSAAGLLLYLCQAEADLKGD